jgi:hypothetical protein
MAIVHTCKMRNAGGASRGEYAQVWRRARAVIVPGRRRPGGPGEDRADNSATVTTMNRHVATFGQAHEEPPECVYSRHTARLQRFAELLANIAVGAKDRAKLAAEAQLKVAKVKVHLDDVALDAATRLLELGGASAASRQRTVRTCSTARPSPPTPTSENVQWVWAAAADDRRRPQAAALGGPTC